MSASASLALALAAATPGTPSSPPTPSRVEATASLYDGFQIRSADRAFGVRFGFFGQLRSRVNATQPVRLHKARPNLEMDLWNDRVHTRLMPELAGNKAELLDAEVTVRAHEALSFNVGQYRPWLSRGFRTGLPVQALVDRGAVVDAFRIDRDVGVTALGRPAGGRFEYYLGVLSGAPRSAAGLYTARLVFAPLGGVPYTQTPYLGSASRPRFALGLAGHVYGRHVEGRPDLGASADLAASAGRIAALAEGFWRRGLVARDSWGAYGQLSVLLVKRWLDLAGRVGAMNRGNAFELHTEAGLNLYLAGHHAKLQLSYGHTATWPAPHTAIAQAQFMI